MNHEKIHKVGEDERLYWYLPKDYKPSKDRSQRYIISGNQLRMLFCMRFSPLDFNRDYVKEFIEKEKLNGTTI